MAADAQAGLLRGGGKPGRVAAGLQLSLNSPGQGTKVVAEGQPAQGAQPGGDLLAGDAVQQPRPQPAVNRGPAVLRTQVVARPVERGQQQLTGP